MGVAGTIRYPLYLMNKKFCISCGIPYIYNSNNPRGATSSACASCSKKNAKQDKRLRSLFIAGNDDVRCRVCGYDRWIEALTTYAVKDFIKKTEPDEVSRKSFVCCLNCKAALEAKQIAMEVKDSSAYPVAVDFYDTQVIIEQNPIVQRILRPPFSDDSIDLEVVPNEPEKEQEFRTVTPEKRVRGRNTK